MRELQRFSAGFPLLALVLAGSAKPRSPFRVTMDNVDNNDAVEPRRELIIGRTPECRNFS